MKLKTLTGLNPFSPKKASVKGIRKLLGWTPFFLILLIISPGLWAQDADEGNPLDIQSQKKVSPQKPVNISSNRLNFDRLNGLTLFHGNVQVIHDKVTVNSDELQATADNREATALGNVKVFDKKSNIHMTCGNLEYRDLLNSITAHDHPILSTLDENGLPITIRSRQMELFADKKMVVAHQDVEIIHDEGRSEAQLATFYADNDQLILEESPRVFITRGVLSGRRITSSLGGERKIIVDGMAEAEFYNSNQPVPAKPPGVGSSTPLPPDMGVTAITNSSQGVTTGQSNLSGGPGRTGGAGVSPNSVNPTALLNPQSPVTANSAPVSNP
jgi:lipopolysaccharide export system protein LptA